MKDTYNTLNLTLPIFILVSFMSICGIVALLELLKGFVLAIS